jgi:hypothetical protein
MDFQEWNNLRALNATTYIEGDLLSNFFEFLASQMYQLTRGGSEMKAFYEEIQWSRHVEMEVPVQTVLIWLS